MTTDFNLTKCDFIETLRSLTQKQVALELLDKISIVHIAAHVESNSGNRILAPPNRSHTQPYSFVPKPESYTLLQKVSYVKLEYFMKLELKLALFLPHYGLLTILLRGSLWKSFIKNFVKKHRSVKR